MCFNGDICVYFIMIELKFDDVMMFSIYIVIDDINDVINMTSD